MIGKSESVVTSMHRSFDLGIDACPDRNAAPHDGAEEDGRQSRQRCAPSADRWRENEQTEDENAGETRHPRAAKAERRGHSASWGSLPCRRGSSLTRISHRQFSLAAASKNALDAVRPGASRISIEGTAGARNGDQYQ